MPTLKQLLRHKNQPKAKLHNTICIYPKDVQLVTGKSERYGRTIIKAIKKHLNKDSHQLVTIDEFCTFMGLEISKVEGLIK